MLFYSVQHSAHSIIFVWAFVSLARKQCDACNQKFDLGWFKIYSATKKRKRRSCVFELVDCLLEDGGCWIFEASRFSKSIFRKYISNIFFLTSNFLCYFYLDSITSNSLARSVTTFLNGLGESYRSEILWGYIDL